MRRFDYRVTLAERHLGIDVRLAVAPALRAPLAVLACSIVLVALVWSAEHLRLLAAERDGERYEHRLAAVESDVARVRALEADVARLRDLDERVAEIRRSGVRQANEIAALGNRIPSGAWLTSLRAEPTQLSIEGGGAHIETVAATLAGLGALRPYTAARLLSIHDDPVHAGLTYAVALETPR